MALAENFSVIESDPDWGNLTLPEQNQIRREWIIKKWRASGKAQDPSYRQRLEAEAFASAPEFARPYQPSWKERHPSLYGAGATAVGVPLRLLETPQQIVAALVDPILRGKKYPATFGGGLQALKEPFEKAGKFMTEGEETELPGGEVTRILTDPLMYTGVGELTATRAAARAAPKGVKMLPALTRGARKGMTEKALTGVGEWVEEIPRSWATWNDPQRQVYKLFMQRGQRYIPRDQLQRVAETLVNAGPEQGAEGLRTLREGNPNKIRSLIAWTESPPWSRRVLRGKKAAAATPPPVTPPSGTVPPVVEQVSQPGGWADVLEQMMKPPTL